MAGYYDPSKDYSKELQRTDLSAAERAQLTQERNNKIQGQYGGKEPNMIGSNKTYTETYGGGSSGGSSSGGSSGNGTVSGGSTSDLVKGPGYVTGGYTTGVNGTAILGDNPYWNGDKTRPDTSRRPDLAGKIAVSNGYTVYYDQDGYAYKASKGAADYLPSQDFYVKNGTYNGGNLWTDEEMVSASDLAAIQDIRNRLNSGQLTAAQANQLANQIRSGYGYTIDTAGNVYDSGVGAAVAARRQQLGLDTGAVTDAQQQYLKLMFPEQGTDDSSALLNALYALQQGNYNPDTKYAGTAGSGAPTSGNGLGSYGSLNGSGGYGGFGGSSMEQYINDLYAQQLEAELAALKTAYDNNVAEVNAQNDRIAEQYRAARNQAASQNALETQRMNELGIAQGLNTGATGQMALAQNMAYQGNLGNLWAQEAQDKADVDLMLAQLLNQYNGSVQQTTAQSNAQRTQALLEEMVRQQELAAQEQALSREYAMNLLSSGVMPDSSTLASAGISGSEANSLAQIYQQQLAAATASQSATKPTLTWAQVKKELEDGNTSPAVLSGYEYYMGQSYPTGSGTSATAAGTTAKRTGSSGYNNGGLSTAEVKRLQQDINKYLPSGQKIAEDGKWGSATANAVGGMTAQQYAQIYYNQNSWGGRSDR